MIRIRRMTAADIPLGMRLKEQAGWNQTEADWRRFLTMEPKGCFVAEYNDNPVGTTTTCIFGKVAWIAMVLVDKGWRRRGIGKSLMEHALAYLDAAGVRSARLDATPLGQPLYEKLGFQAQYELARFVGVLPAHGKVAEVRCAKEKDLDEIIRLDRRVTRTSRGKLLRQLFADQPQEVWLAQTAEVPSGYLTVRRGSEASQLGPCICEKGVGSLLLNHACHVYGGVRVYMDVPRGNAPASLIPVAWGFAEQRCLVRMCRGPTVCEKLECLWTSSGPEKG